ncbi:MAG TPA: hypothetical protein VK254_01790 [Candidatus Bathyarchaeia archaeon]|nr:hypothetical protein [Candidatus Bathyarchaeia archaeon]
MANGKASQHLVEKLCELEIPVVGTVKRPYVPGEKISNDIVKFENDPDYSFILKKSHVLQALSRISAQAAEEFRDISKGLLHIPMATICCERVL